jgi:hypothetical protein
LKSFKVHLRQRRVIFAEIRNDVEFRGAAHRKYWLIFRCAAPTNTTSVFFYKYLGAPHQTIADFCDKIFFGIGFIYLIHLKGIVMLGNFKNRSMYRSDLYFLPKDKILVVFDELFKQRKYWRMLS